MATRIETADELVTAAFVFVRQARREGAMNVVNKITFAECATVRGLSADDFSIKTCCRIARQRAKLMDEYHLLGEDIR